MQRVGQFIHFFENYTPIENDDSTHSIRSEKGCSGEESGITDSLDVEMNTHRLFWYVLGVVTQGVVHWLLVKLVRRSVDDDGCIDEVLTPVGTACWV